MDQEAQTRAFAELLESAGLSGMMHGVGPYTVLVPSNQAVADLGPDLLARLKAPANQYALTRLLSYHIIPVKLLLSDVVPVAPIDTLHGAKVTFARDGSTVTVEQARVVGADVDATNGSVQIIDRVLLPPDFDEGSLQQP